VTPTRAGNAIDDHDGVQPTLLALNAAYAAAGRRGGFDELPPTR
jgi:hypothetical protein